MRRPVTEIAKEIKALEMQGTPLTFRKKHELLYNQDVLNGKMSVEEAYGKMLGTRSQTTFLEPKRTDYLPDLQIQDEAAPASTEEKGSILKMMNGGSLPKMQDAGSLMTGQEMQPDPTRPSAEEYRRNIQQNYSSFLQKNSNTPYIPGVTEGGMNCINGVCSLVKGTGAKQFTRDTYTGNATFNDNLEKEGYYTVDPTKEAFEIGDVVQYSRRKGRAERFGGKTTPLTENELYPQHAKLITDKFVDEDGETQYVIVHNSGKENMFKKTISETDLLSHTKGYGSGLTRFDGLLVQRYGPEVVAQRRKENEERQKVLQGQNEFAKEYNAPVTGISFSKKMQTPEGEEYDKRVNKDLAKVYTENYSKLANMSNMPKSTFDKMLALQAGIQHMESGKGGLRAAAKSVVTTVAPSLLDEARRISSDSDAKTWVDVYWKDNAENVREKFETKENFISHLNKDNKLSPYAREWAYYNSPPSKGAFQQKELSERGRFLSLNPKLESYNDQAIASITLMMDNYHRAKKKYPDATEEELLDLSVLMHNAPSKAMTPEFYRYFVKNKDVDYVNEVKKYVPNIKIDQQETREVSKDEKQKIADFINSLSDAGPQMRYGGSLPDLPKYQTGTPTAADSARVYKSYLDFKNAVESSPYEYRQMSEGEKGRRSRIDAIVNTALPVQEIDPRIKPKSITPLISDRKEFLAGHPDFKQNKNIANTIKGKIAKYSPSGFQDAVMLHDYSNLASSMGTSDLSEGDFPTPDEINNMGIRPAPTPTTPITKTLNSIEEISGKIVNEATGESWTKEEWEALKGKGSFGKARQKARMQYGGFLPKYQNGTNSFPQVTDKYGNKGTRVKLVGDIDQDTGKAYAAYAPLNSLPEATVTAKLDRTNPTAVRNWSRTNDPVAYATREATENVANNYMLPVAEALPGSGDVYDLMHLGKAIKDRDYGTLGLAAGAAALPFVTYGTLKGGKKLLQEAIYRGVEPLDYRLKDKVRDFVPNLIKNSRRTADERALELGYNMHDGISMNGRINKSRPMTKTEIVSDIKNKGWNPNITDQEIFEKINISHRRGADLLDAFNMGLRRKQNWDTFTEIGDNTFRINNQSINIPNASARETEVPFFSRMDTFLNRHNKYLENLDEYKRFREEFKDSSEEMLREYGISKPTFDLQTSFGHFEPGKNRFHIHGNKGAGDLIRGSYTVDVNPSTGGGPIKFTSIDNWDLNPLEGTKFKDLEFLRLVGGKPYTIKNTYEVDPQTFNVLRSYKKGGYLKKYMNMGRS